MSTKFFTNSTGNTLFDKFKGIAADMINFDSWIFSQNKKKKITKRVG